MTLDGFEVLTVRPDFADEPNLTGARANRMVALSPARALGFFNGQKPIHTLAHKYILDGSEIRELEDFFNASKGRWRTFLVPSWTGELGCGETNLTGTPMGSPSLNIDWCDYAANYGTTDGRLGRYIFILWEDGTFFVSKVEGIFSSTPGVTDELDLASALPKDVPADNSVVIGFLYLVRFSSDELELSFSGPAVAGCDVAFVEQTISTPVADVT